MVQEEVAGVVIVGKVGAVRRVPAVLVRVEITIPLMLANNIFHKVAPFMVVGPWYKMCLRFDQYTAWHSLVVGGLHDDFRL
jgi:hypothetical protein